MSEERHPDPDPGFELEDDEAIEGTVVPLPGPVPDTPKRQRAGGEHAELRDIIPAHLRTWAGVKKALGWRYKHARHHVLFHLVRSPKMLPMAFVWAVVGLLRVDAAFIAWAFATEQAYLRGMTIEAADIKTYLQIHKEGKETRLFRVPVLIAAHVAAVIAGVFLTVRMPLLWIPAGLVALPFLASAGRPDDKPIVQSAVVPTAYEQLSLSLLIVALGSLGIGEMNKALARDPENAIKLVDLIVRDGDGWLARLDLPHGVTAAMVQEKREELASGLRRPIGCVWPETERKRHPGALNLYVGDEDMTQAEQPPWPLAKRGTADLFKPQIIGYDPRGRPITITLMYASVVIGSIPRMGKSFLLRLLLLIAALDPRSELHMYDLKGTGDLNKLRTCAHRYRAGDQDEDVEYLLADLRGLGKELSRRTKIINDLSERDDPRCPESKVTPELASDPALGLHPIVIALDECQRAYEHKRYGAEIQEIAEDLAKRGPALAIMILLATQRPDAKSIPPGIKANVVLRICLKVMGWRENDMVLGDGMNSVGVTGVMFSREDLGVFWINGEGVAPQIGRGQKIDVPASKVIALRARALRERAGNITGYAAGQDQVADVRRIIDDVLTIFGDAKGLWCETIAERLAGSFPDVYADITADAVASQLRAQDINVRGVRDTTKRGEGPRSGCYRAELEQLSETGDV